MKRWFKLIICMIFTVGILYAFDYDNTVYLNNSNNTDQTNKQQQKKESKKQANQNIAQSTLFMDVYQNIMHPNCALSSCHDGNFEPDFTSPEAAYYTTVWHGVKKNSSDYRFTFRIVPYKLEDSQLYERITNCCFNNEDDRMPLLMGSLTATQIDSIAQWIMKGAPNIYDEFPYTEYGME